ncbi:hypothetical protein FB45DRAFT_1036840 [Roridomyces roridus]|uniref:F-box domain-containing protein n=1 Tax=Roridomyces roridus TaxID=1738132 RepID=A0AAD7B7L5_9AGAR|nr:hypothetical protein FB45DRAFT_1036840 [Roridomyces roridus]
MDAEPATVHISQLPPEVWLLCWSQCSRRLLRRLSVVCRLFRSLVLPLLWEAQTFDASKDFSPMTSHTQIRHLHRTAVRLDRMADSGAPYASWVRSLTITSRRSYHWQNSLPPHLHTLEESLELFRSMHSRILLAFSTALPLCSNLATLHLTHMHVDDSLLKSLGSLSRLEALHLNLCNFGILQNAIVLPIEHLELTECTRSSDNGVLRIASPHTLRTLNPDYFIAQLLRGFGSEDLEQLVTLSLPAIFDIALVIALLKRCSALESLTIQTITLELDFPPLPLLVLPRLRALDAPHYMHPWLVPGRPITSATVGIGQLGHWDDDTLVRTCLAISYSAAPILSLAVCRPTVPRLETLVKIFSLFPELQELLFSVDNPTHIRVERRCCLRSASRRVPPSLVQPPPDLRDDFAFDEVPVEEISDGEEGRNEIIVVRADEADALAEEMKPPSNNFQNTLNWLMDGKLTLPPNIQVLQLQIFGPYAELPWMFDSRHIARLVARYPRLRKLGLGSRFHHWEKNSDECGTLWKSTDRRKGWVRVVS